MVEVGFEAVVLDPGPEPEAVLFGEVGVKTVSILFVYDADPLPWAWDRYVCH